MLKLPFTSVIPPVTTLFSRLLINEIVAYSRGCLVSISIMLPVTVTSVRSGRWDCAENEINKRNTKAKILRIIGFC